MLNERFHDRKQLDRYRDFTENGSTDSCADSSLKAEHGTGRNVAPFVSRQFGENSST